MLVVSVWNPKGGQGKSTVVINLAAAAIRHGLSAIVIDRDEQGTSMLYHQAGQLQFEVLGDYPDEAPKVDLVLIDHMANDRRVPVSGTLIMPVVPKRSQYAAYIGARQMAEELSKHIVTVVINGDPRRLDERNVIYALKNEGALEVRASGVFGRADAEYRTIFDEKMNRVYGIKERRDEFHKILNTIMTI